MSLSLDNDTVSSIKKLAGNQDFKFFVAALGKVAHKTVLASLDASPEGRVGATSYARGLRDLYIAVDAVIAGSKYTETKFPDSGIDRVSSAPMNMVDPVAQVREAAGLNPDGTRKTASQTETSASPTPTPAPATKGAAQSATTQPGRAR